MPADHPEARSPSPPRPGRRRRRLLDWPTQKLTWPLLLLSPAVGVLVGLALLVQGVGQIVTANGTRWERAQQSAVISLGRYAQSCNEADYRAYQAYMDVPWALESGRRALFSSQPDRAAAHAAYLRTGVPAQEARVLVHVLPWLSSFSMHQAIGVIWEQANDIAHDIDRHAQRLHEAVAGGCSEAGSHGALMAPVYAADRALAPLRAAFDEAARQARWRLSVMVLLSLAVIALPMTLTGYLLTARLQRRASADSDALALSEQRLQQALDGSGYGLWDLPLGGGAVRCSAAMMALLGHEAHEQALEQADFLALLHPEDRLGFMQRLRSRGADGQRLEAELRLRGRDGQYRWFKLAGQSVPVAPGQVQRMIGSVADVTERRAMQRAIEDELALRRSALQALRATLAQMVSADEAARGPAADLDTFSGASLGKATDTAAADSQDEIGATTRALARIGARLRESNEQLEAVFSLSSDAFVSFDEQLRVSLLSPAFDALTGLSASTLLGQPAAWFFEVLGAQCRPDTPLPSLLALLRQGGNKPLTLELATRPPRTLSLELLQGQHPLARQVLCLRDVTQQRQVERLKSEFITVAAHELRTPMTIIFGYVEMILQRPLDAQRLRQLHTTIHAQCQLMVGILDDLMDLGRLEARQGLALKIAEVDLAALLRSTAAALPVPAGRQRPQRRNEHAWPDVRVAGDAGSLVRVINNVLGNAYKYSPETGLVELSLARRTTADGQEEACIAITDEGIGMTPEQLARVGERFYRADTSGHIPGTGLGMSIVGEIVKLHGGRLVLHSRPGLGTRVEIMLPALAAVQVQHAPGQAPPSD